MWLWVVHQPFLFVVSNVRTISPFSSLCCVKPQNANNATNHTPHIIRAQDMSEYRHMHILLIWHPSFSFLPLKVVVDFAQLLNVSSNRFIVLHNAVNIDTPLPPQSNHFCFVKVCPCYFLSNMSKTLPHSHTYTHNTYLYQLAYSVPSYFAQLCFYQEGHPKMRPTAAPL